MSCDLFSNRWFMLDIESKVLRYATAQIDDSVTYTDFEFTKEQKQILNELKTCSESEKENLVDKFNASLEVESLKRAYMERLTKTYIAQLKKCLEMPIDLDSKEMMEFVKEERNLRLTDSSKKFDSELILERYKNFFNKDFMS